MKQLSYCGLAPSVGINSCNSLNLPPTQVVEDDEKDEEEDGEEDGRGEVMKGAWWNEDVKLPGRHMKVAPHVFTHRTSPRLTLGFSCLKTRGGSGCKWSELNQVCPHFVADTWLIDPVHQDNGVLSHSRWSCPLCLPGLKGLTKCEWWHVSSIKERYSNLGSTSPFNSSRTFRGRRKQRQTPHKSQQLGATNHFDSMEKGFVEVFCDKLIPNFK